MTQIFMNDIILSFLSVDTKDTSVNSSYDVTDWASLAISDRGLLTHSGLTESIAGDVKTNIDKHRQTYY